MAYIFCADIYCDTCGESLKKDRQKPVGLIDSNDYPVQVDGTSEADSPQHCGMCHVFLENDLTPDGVNYTAELIANDLCNKRVGSVAVTEWLPFYGKDYDLLLNEVVLQIVSVMSPVEAIAKLVAEDQNLSLILKELA